MRVALITTVWHNVGDDFVRAGIKYLLKKMWPDKYFKFENIHKHAPITARYGFSRVRKNFDKLDRLLPLKWTRDRILESDLVVQCGAPIYWCHDSVNAHCYDNEWFEPLIIRRLSKKSTSTFLNIAGGSCQTYHSDSSEICSSCRQYIGSLYDAAEVTTLRDELAGALLEQAGGKAPVLPCTSLFAADEHNIQTCTSDYVALNFMPLAGHYAFGQSIDSARWQSVMLKFYADIRKRARIIFACHDVQEIEAARSIDPQAELFYADNHIDYLKFYAHAGFGIVNRLHAALALAGLGKPALVIGNDTRTRMVDLIQGQRLYVNDATVDSLVEHFGELEDKARDYETAIRNIKQKAQDDYMNALADVL